MSNEDREYIPHFKKVQEAKDTIVTEHKKTLKNNHNIKMSEPQVRFGEVFTRLLNDPDFKFFLEFEQRLHEQALMQSFARRSGVQTKDGNSLMYSKTYGEDMSYNEGYQHGLFRFKGERESILKSYIEFQRQIQEGKNENEKDVKKNG